MKFYHIGILLLNSTEAFFNKHKSKASCEPLPHPRNGYIECTNKDHQGNFNIGAKCNFFCYDGFELEGTSKTSCNRKGLWTSRQIPECVQIGNHLIPAEPPADSRLESASESLTHFNQPKDGTPTDEQMELVKISTDVMVSFLEFILENPQTNSAHAFKAFQNGDLGHGQTPSPEYQSEMPSYDFEEMESPQVDYDDEYESDFYTNFDDDLFNSHNWTTTWDDPHMNWVAQAHIDANHGFNAAPYEPTTTTTTTTTSSIQTTGRMTSARIVIPQPEADFVEIESDGLTVTWFKSSSASSYNVKLYERSTRRLVNDLTSEGDFVTFDNLEPATEYVATVMAITASGAKSQETEILIETSPNPPVLSTSNIGPTQIRVHWSRITSALSYVVTVLDDNKNQVFSDFKFPSFDSMDIGDLFPNTEYTIIVHAILINDRQVSSTVVHRTSEPSKINLHVVSVESDTIEVEWTQSIGIRNYEIEITLFDLAAKLKTEKLDTNTNTFKITTLMPFTQYEINLKGYYTHGIFTEVSKVVRTNSIAPVITIDSFGADWSAVSWSRVPGAVQFKLNLYQDDVKVQGLIFEKNQSQARFSSLSPYVDYEVEIIATLVDTDSNLSGFTRFKTNPVPPEIQLETITSTSVDFGWTAVPDTEIYSIAITTSDGGQMRTSEVSGTTTNFEFHDLEHWKEYTITVSARQILDSFTGDVKFRTKSIPPGISIVSTSFDSFSLTWSPVPGVIGGYMVTVADSESVFKKETSFKATNLPPFTSYQVQVTGETPDGDRYNSKISVTTDPENPKVSVESISSNGVVLSWPQIPATSSYMTVIRNQEGKVFDQPRSHHLNRFEFNQLAPYSRYTIQVSAQYGDKTLASEIDILTDPEPAVINIKHIGATYVSVWWPAVPGTTEYIVHLLDEVERVIQADSLSGSLNILEWEQFNLSPESFYSIRVLAKHEEKTFDNSLIIETLPVPEMPKIQPSAVFSTKVTLIWERPIDWDIEDKPYIISPMFLELEYSRLGQSKPEIIIIEKSLNSITVEGLDSGFLYNFSMRGIYSFGASEASSTSSVTAPLITNMVINTVSSTSAVIEWDQIGEAVSYYASILPKIPGQKNPIKIWTPRLELSGLKMESSYSVSVFAELEGSNTDSTTGPVFKTSPPPPELLIDEITSTSMKLSSSFTEDAIMYEIQFYPTREPEFDAEVTLHGHGVVKLIEDLMPNTYYTFKLRAIMAHDRAHTDWTTSSYTTAPEEAELWFDHIRSSSLELHWKPVPGALLYSISMTPSLPGFPTIVTANEQMLSVFNLEPDTDYEFEVITSVDFGRTDPAIANQKTVIAPPVVSLDGVRSTWLDMSWNDQSECDMYEVQIIPNIGQVFHRRNTLHVTEMTSDSNYTVVVDCIVSFGRSDSSISKFQTAVEPPQPIISGLRSTSGVISWGQLGSSADQFSAYQLTVSELPAMNLGANETLVDLSDLAPDSEYLAILESFPRSGGQSDSIELGFRTAPMPPQIVFEEIWSSDAILTWNNYPRFDHYNLRFDPDIGFVPPKIFGNMLPISHLQSNTTFTVYMKGVTSDYETDEHVEIFTTAPQPPIAKISEVRTSSFKIEWGSVEGAMHYELEMFPVPTYANDEGIIIVSAARNNFLAQNLDPATDYQINLVAVMDTNTKTTKVNLIRRTAPEAPILAAQEITSSKMSLSWSATERISHYILDVFPKTEQIPENFQFLGTKYDLTNLKPDTTYQIQIRAILMDESETDLGYLQALTAPPPPTMMMANVRTTTAKIFWTKSPRFNNFRVSVTPPLDGKRNFDRNSTVLILENTKPSVEYKIEVVGLVDGAETDSSSIKILTAPAPIVASAKEKRSTSIRVDWAAVPNAYKYIAIIDPPTQAGLSKIPINTNFIKLGNLAPKTSYTMKITAVSQNGAWTTDEHVCQFATGPELGPVLIQNVTSKAMFLSWDDLPEVDFYTIKLTPPIGPNPNESIRSNLAQIWLQDMNPDTKYSIELCGWSEKEGDDFHTDSVLYTQFTAPPAPVINFPRIKSRRLELSWSELPSDYAYYLDVRPIPEGYEDKLPLKLTINRVTITGMEPETLYYFMVKAKSESKSLTTDEFVTSQATAPLGPPIVIPVHNIRTTSALIEWEEIPHAVQYKLAAWSRDDKHYAVSYVTRDIHHILQGLKKLSTYVVQVSAVLDDGGETDVSEVEFETAPAPPQLRVYRARVQRDATVKVNCSMSSIPDKASYSINMSPPVGNMEHEHTTDEFYFGASGLNLGKNYMFGIFATMEDGKRTDVRSMTYKTPTIPRCYSCNSVGSPSDCQEEVPCPLMGGYSCMTFDRRENGRRMLTRGCKKRDACNTQRSSHKCFGNKGKLSQCILVGCCDDDLCNEGNNLNGPFDPKFKNRPDNRPWE